MYAIIPVVSGDIAIYSGHTVTVAVETMQKVSLYSRTSGSNVFTEMLDRVDQIIRVTMIR